MGAKASRPLSPRCGGGGKKRGMTKGSSICPGGPSATASAPSTPSSSSTPASAHAAGEYDEIVAWLEWQFRKSDLNKDGSVFLESLGGKGPMHSCRRTQGCSIYTATHNSHTGRWTTTSLCALSARWT